MKKRFQSLRFKRNLHRYNAVMMRHASVVGQNQGGYAPGFQQPPAAGVVANASAQRFSNPAAPEGRDADETLDMLTLWAKLDGFSPGGAVHVGSS